jgi:phosphoribosyl 1,2-cyclic phosphodiesterase
MFSYTPIVSSSKGNCTLIETKNTKVLVDAGVSFRKLSKALYHLAVDPSEIKYIFITHAHSDHMSGLLSILKALNIKVLTREKTYEVLLEKVSGLSHFSDRFHLIKEKMVAFGDLAVSFFKLPHKGWTRYQNLGVGEHIGFLFEYSKDGDIYKLAYTTDVGHFTDRIKEIIKGCDAYIMESNYDHDLQLSSPRPKPLIQRNLGLYGHLSNVQAGDYLSELGDHKKTKQVFLAHLSEQCNSHQLALDTVTSKLKPHLSQVIVSTQISKRYHIV